MHSVSVCLTQLGKSVQTDDTILEKVPPKVMPLQVYTKSQPQLEIKSCWHSIYKNIHFWKTKN